LPRLDRPIGSVVLVAAARTYVRPRSYSPGDEPIITVCPILISVYAPNAPSTLSKVISSAGYVAVMLI
jgi:hypothetical protein